MICLPPSLVTRPGSARASWKTTCVPLATFPSQDVCKDQQIHLLYYCVLHFHARAPLYHKLPGKHGLLCKGNFLWCNHNHLACQCEPCTSGILWIKRHLPEMQKNMLETNNTQNQKTTVPVACSRKLSVHHFFMFLSQINTQKTSQTVILSELVFLANE